MIISLVTLFLSFLYASFLFWCFFYWKKIPERSGEELNYVNIKVAVVVPVRNEAHNLPFLLKSLSSQDYKQENFRIIVSDDHSTDNTLEIAELFFSSNKIENGFCLRSPGKSKKSAIEFAVEHADAELIILTDADTWMGKEWISSLVNEYVNSGAFLICGPVKLKGNKNIFEKVQAIEFAGLLGIGAAGIKAKNPIFCNGANLAFSRKIFNDVGGYRQSTSASGDDTQLLLKVHKSWPDRISFLKDSRSIVQTNVLSGKSDFWQQRKRWASKIPFTLSSFTISASLLAWLLHVFLLIQFIVAFYCNEFVLLVLSLSLKIVSEIVFLNSVGRFLQSRIPVWMVILVQPFYCLYIVGVGLMAPFGKFQWKGRSLQ